MSEQESEQELTEAQAHQLKDYQTEINQRIAKRIMKWTTSKGHIGNNIDPSEKIEIDTWVDEAGEFQAPVANDLAHDIHGFSPVTNRSDAAGIVLHRIKKDGWHSEVHNDTLYYRLILKHIEMASAEDRKKKPLDLKKLASTGWKTTKTIERRHTDLTFLICATVLEAYEVDLNLPELPSHYRFVAWK